MNQWMDGWILWMNESMDGWMDVMDQWHIIDQWMDVMDRYTNKLSRHHCLTHADITV